MIDLHLHTTASDGELSPTDLVARAAAAGLTIVAVTDHDTLAGLPEARDAAARHAVRLIDGIEITAVEQGRDVHVLGYFMDAASATLLEFLRGQRADRIRRVRAMVERLATLGFPVDIEPALGRSATMPGRSVGRPLVADALVAAGHAADRRDAFDRLLGFGRPAFVARCGARVASVVATIHRAGGIASLAHPGLTRMDGEIPGYAEAGLDAIEAVHSDHDAEAERAYRHMAVRLGLAVSGGSDFHGQGSHHAPMLGLLSLPSGDFADLERRAAARAGGRMGDA
ncbi:MAG TPA: PHP domain-containing protein [Vicinamibacterales bacterium]|nr:PHP domain-containing protein [Vicinamibacterales bacterium]